ncbi:MAG: protein kinase [Gemmatimonadota bacterium]|nr:MAG: protein kinase [Gemmatimonadota bacterium]
MSAGRPTLTPEEVSELRHELRTPINHIVGYAEMLLEDLPDADAAGRRGALEETLVLARGALDLINHKLAAGASGATQVATGELSTLYESLREPQARILNVVAPLLASVSGNEPELVADLRRILTAAEKLVPLDVGGADADPGTAEEAGTAAAASDEADSGPARILVVDDVEANRDLLRRRLEREGHVVECAENGQRALEAIRARGYDLVLLDVMMPEIDGYQVLGYLKDDPATRDIPVIMISAADDMPNIVRCIERGAEDFLPKPFDPVLLRARINASLEKKRLRDHEVEYLRQVDRVIKAASAVEKGNYAAGALADVAARADQLGKLARVFDGMVAQVRAREERLHEQVRDLKSEIEAARRAARPPEAADLDFASLPAGERFAERYEIIEVVGAGGMGMVYRARDLELDEDVAIKTLRPELVSDAALTDRFKTEIRLARKISHRNVVRTHDLGEWKGVYFLTMEFVEGITLRELIDSRGQIGVSSTLAIAAQLAESLEVAHERGVVHRDIKPQNLLLDADAVLKVMDFGVARLAERSSTRTEAGLIIGTPAYMSPEQLLAEPTDARSDLYSVGVVMYECLTGTLPFQANSTISLIGKVLNVEPSPPNVINLEVSPALSILILELLAKKPEERLGSARELRERLAQIG